MTRPSDIDQATWDAAMAVQDAAMNECQERKFAVTDYPFHSGNAKEVLDLHIARAILAAKAEQREADAKIADQYVWDEHALAQATDIGRAVHHQSLEIAAAIRKGAA